MSSKKSELRLPMGSTDVWLPETRNNIINNNTHSSSPERRSPLARAGGNRLSIPNSTALGGSRKNVGSSKSLSPTSPTFSLPPLPQSERKASRNSLKSPNSMASSMSHQWIQLKGQQPTLYRIFRGFPRSPPEHTEEERKQLQARSRSVHDLWEKAKTLTEISKDQPYLPKSSVGNSGKKLVTDFDDVVTTSKVLIPSDVIQRTQSMTQLHRSRDTIDLPTVWTDGQRPNRSRPSVQHPLLGCGFDLAALDTDEFTSRIYEITSTENDEINLDSSSF